MIKTNILILPSFPPLKNTVLPRFRVSNVKKKIITHIKLKPLMTSLSWSLHHENISFRTKVIPINVLKIPVLILPVMVLNRPLRKLIKPDQCRLI